MVVYLVITIRCIPNDDYLYGDIILITEDEKQARNVCHIVKKRLNYPGLDYNKLVAFDDCIYVARKVGKVLYNRPE